MAGLSERPAEVTSQGRPPKATPATGMQHMANDNAGYRRSRTFDVIGLAVAVPALGPAVFLCPTWGVQRRVEGTEGATVTTLLRSVQ